MAEEIAQNGEVPPAGESIHLPGPSFLPVIVAAGITIAVVGVVLNWVVFGIGVAITVVSIWRWAAETRADVASLPLSHD